MFEGKGINSSFSKAIQRKIFGYAMTDEMATMTFEERWKEHRRLKRQSLQSGPGCGNSCCKYFMRGLMVFQFPTQMYVYMVYIIPYCFADYSEWTQYYLKVLCWFLGINGLANWFCVILFKPYICKSRDRPTLNVADRWNAPPDQFVPLCETATQNGSVVYDLTSEEEGLPWQFCEKCKMHIPPRAHHCMLCQTCILKRDHHCFMVGNCIGFNNQRYFAVLTFYALIIGWAGAAFTYKYLKEVYWVNEADGWTDLVPPVAIYRYIFGNTKLHNCLLVIHIYLELCFGLFGFLYFTAQMDMCFEGKTTFELKKKVPIRNTNSASKNMQSVFGDFWALNFYFPMTIIFRQHGDGFHWDGVKIDHNANVNKKDEKLHNI